MLPSVGRRQADDILEISCCGGLSKSDGELFGGGWHKVLCGGEVYVSPGRLPPPPVAWRHGPDAKLSLARELPPPGYQVSDKISRAREHPSSGGSGDGDGESLGMGLVGRRGGGVMGGGGLVGDWTVGLNIGE